MSPSPFDWLALLKLEGAPSRHVLPSHGMRATFFVAVVGVLVLATLIGLIVYTQRRDVNLFGYKEIDTVVVVGRPIRSLASSNRSCDEDLIVILHEALQQSFANHSSSSARILAGVRPVAKHQDALALRVVLRRLLESEALWSYRAMSTVISILGRAYVGDTQERAEPVREVCLSQIWDLYANRATLALDERLQRIGGRRENNGMIYLCPGFGGLVATRKKGSSFRAGWFPQKLVKKACGTVVSNFTIFFLTFHDEDVYIKTRRRKHDRVELLALLQAFPNMFLMHYSPSMVMPNRLGASFLGDEDPFFVNGSSVLTGAPRVGGTLYPRMIPVPHTPVDQGAIANATKNKTHSVGRVRQRLPIVVWRGATTGYPVPHTVRQNIWNRPFQRFRVHPNNTADKMREGIVAKFAQTDRARMVNAFNDPTSQTSKYNWSDVAFSGFCQLVKAQDVPRYAEKMRLEELMQYRVHIDVDGNTNSWEGLRWRLLLGMVVVKVASSNGFTQWYYRHLENGTHLLHVPVSGVVTAAKVLLDDVALTESIAVAAKKFGEEHLTPDAMEAAVVESVRSAWRIGYDDVTKWCIAPC
jgi:hypothetical protein